MACLIAYHGWGFDHTCWVDWRVYFQQKNHRFDCFDRGYFGQPHNPTFSGDRPYILLLHSYGLHLCPTNMIVAADTIVIFNSFLSFHPSEPRLKRRSQLTLQRMGDRCRTHPQEVLQAFWQTCEAPNKSHPQRLSHSNYPLLQEDLSHLNAVNLTDQSAPVQAIKQTETVWVIHSSADKIVPWGQGATLAEAVATPSWNCIAAVGHGLPFSHPDHCWSLPPFTTLDSREHFS
ncbi:MAG: hypothetical protein VKJ64_10110 [Leptolyngbyaceae bacterium]|nr:hypothetical protein [Leptolyngbyaceae bacterium]